MDNKQSQLIDQTPLWQYLGVRNGASTTEVDEAYDAALKNPPLDQTQTRLAWKILRDPYFGSAYYQLKSTKKILNASFFDNLANIDYDNSKRENPNWMVTPINKIKANISNTSTKPLAVLASTGAYSPIHESHIEMMEIAKTELESQGYNVVGGYVSPSHDIYVSRKNNGTAAFNANHRIHLCQLALEENNWLMTDPWEALHTEIEETYTDVLTRLQNYLNAHIEKPIKLFYVFGSDNASFANAFISHGQAVCVNRPGFDAQLQEVLSDPLIKNNSRLIFSSIKSHESSSTAIREGNYSHLHKSVKEKYTSWQKNFKSEDKIKEYPYFIRDEGTWSTKPWASNRDSATIETARTNLRDQLNKNINHAFNNANNPDEKISVNIHYQNLEQQKAQIAPLIKNKKTISLDACISGDYNLNFSGSFEIADGQFHRKSLTARPGHPTIEKQIKSLPSGNYTLIEDDIATGKTIKIVKELLPNTVKINEMVILTKLSDVEAPEPLDIIDLRDFIVGSNESGLVVELPNGEKARVPYLLPYVSTISRAKLPISSEKNFSINMWKANEDFFKQIIPAITLKEANPSFQKLMNYIGFNNNTSMQEICKWHRERLQTTTKEVDYNIEFAHIYTDEEFSQEQIDSINTLKTTIKKIEAEGKTYVTSILIDNFNPTEQTLDEEAFLNKIRSYGVPVDCVAYEAGFQSMADKLIQLLPKENLKFEYFNKKTKEVLILERNGLKIGLQENYIDRHRHTCAILSASWTLCRLGCFPFPENSMKNLTNKNLNAREIITILPDKYKTSEDKVMEIITSTCHQNQKGRMDYVFHQSTNTLKYKI